MHDFFQAVLPAEGTGTYILFELPSRATRAFKTLADFETAIQRGNESGQANLFFAVGAFKGATRTGDECVAKQAFYIDIDFKDLTLDPDIDPCDWSIAKLREASLAIGVGLPGYLIKSGGGLHAYWPLTEPMEPGMWREAATAFGQALLDAGLPHDNKCYRDLARVLRVPGSYNHKYDPPRLVEIVADRNKRFAPAAFMALVTAAVSSPTAPAFGAEFAARAAALNLKAPVDTPSKRVYWISSIVQSGKCPLFIRSLEPAAQDREAMSEGLWSDLLATCSQAEDGREYAHAYSRHDTERYAPGIVDEKLAAWGGQQHPRTCKTFAQHGLCGGCANATLPGTSPIQFGYKSPDQMEGESGLAEHIIDTLRARYPDRTDAEIYACNPPTQWPAGYGVDTVGFCTMREQRVDDPDGGSKIDTVRAFDGIYWCGERHRDETGKHAYKFWFMPRRDEYPSEAMVDSAVMASQQRTMTMLAEHGFAGSVKTAKLAFTLFNEWMALANRLYTVSHSYPALGWVDDFTAFNFGTVEYRRIGSDIQESVVQMSSVLQKYKVSMHARGTLDGWKAAAATFDGKGRELHQIAILASFASALMPMTLNHSSHVLHLHSTESGSGKTSAQLMGCTVWGAPKNLGTSNTTFNAMLDRFSILGNISGAVDEITMYGAEEYRKLAYYLASGTPRQRLTQDGELRSGGRPWTLIGITSANRDISYEMGRTGNASGEGARVTSLSLGAGCLDIEQQETFLQLEDNYGHAGRVFIRQLMKSPTAAIKAQLRARAKTLLDRHCKTAAARAEQRFRMDMFAAVLYAAEICHEAGLLPYRPDDIRVTIDALLTDLVGNMLTPFESMELDLTSYMAAHSKDIMRAIRGGDGRLRTLRSVSNMAEDLSGAVNFDARRSSIIFVMNDKVYERDRPVLYIPRGDFPGVCDELFPSIRTDPMKTLPVIFRGSDYALAEGTESIGGMRGMYVKIVLPDTYTSEEDVRKAANSISPNLLETMNARLQ